MSMGANYMSIFKLKATNITEKGNSKKSNEFIYK